MNTTNILKQLQIQTQLVDYFLNQIGQLAQLDALSELELSGGGTIVCKVSGLAIGRIKNLPWGAIPHSLPFYSYDWKAIQKFQQLADKPESTNETKHFLLFSLLAKTPADFSQLQMRSSFHFYNLSDKELQSVYSRGLKRLYNFADFYSRLELKYQKRFPSWKMGSTGAEVTAKDERTHVFGNFFQVLSLWEQIATKYFDYRGVKEHGKKLESDAEQLLAIGTDEEDSYSSVQESIYKKIKELERGKIITIFDSRSIDRKKLPQTVLLLRSFYKLSHAEFKEFHYIVYAAKDCSIMRLEKLKGFILDRAAIEEDFPVEHTYFLTFLNWHIAAKKRIEQTLSIIQEEREANPIYVKLKAAEEKQLEQLHNKGMPNKANFKTTASYLQAVMSWKKQQGGK